MWRKINFALAHFISTFAYYYIPLRLKNKISNMKKLFITLPILLIVLSSTSCGARNSIVKQQAADISTSIDGVVIEGIRWATRNVDMPGTFAENPEDFGMFYQWNRKKAWNTTDKDVEGWNSTGEIGTRWYVENDPCPPGWRVPTHEELRSLNNAGQRRIRNARPELGNWTMRNGVEGRLFGVAPNQIFLPAIHLRDNNSGRIIPFRETLSVYWSSNEGGTTAAHALFFFSGSAVTNQNVHRAAGGSIRCVAKK